MGERPPVTDWATDFDHLSEEWAAHGPEILAELRERCPVAHTDRFHGAYVVTRFDDVMAVAHDPATFSSRVTMVTEAHPDNVKLSLGPLTLDPPMHGPVKRALLPTFNPRRVAELRPLVETIVEELLDDVAGHDVVDGASAIRGAGADEGDEPPLRRLTVAGRRVPPVGERDPQGWSAGHRSRP